MKKQIASLALAVFSFTLSACVTAGPTKPQALVWKPTDTVSDFNVGSISKYKFKVGTFHDERKVTPKNKVGENVEQKAPRPMLVDTDNFGPFVSTNIASTLEKAGLDVSPTAGLTLTGTIKDLSVHEDNTYVGTAVIRYALKKGETEVWSGVMTGSSKRFGRSYKFDNYMESISDSTMDSMKKLLNDPEFRSALKK